MALYLPLVLHSATKMRKEDPNININTPLKMTQNKLAVLLPFPNILKYGGGLFAGLDVGFLSSYARTCGLVLKQYLGRSIETTSIEVIGA